MSAKTNANKNTLEHPLTKEITSIRIQAKKARLRLIPQKGHRLSIRSDKPLRVTKENTEEKETITLIISEKDFPPEESGGFNLGGKQNNILIRAPITWPITVLLFRGQVMVEPAHKVGRFNNLSIRIAGPGLVRTRNTKGTLHVSQREGDVHIHSHKGSLTVQGERAKARFQTCSGEMSFVGFKSQLQVDNSKGSLTTRAFKLPLTVNKFRGRLDFRQEKGPVYLKSMTGSISGYSKEGEVRGLIYPKEVSIETKTGRIHLDVPHSRAWVQADTSEGRLWTPTYFNRTRTGGMDRAQGRLKGKGKQAGRVSLKSHAGSIKIYQSTL